jgi:hypothetical protein
VSVSATGGCISCWVSIGAASEVISSEGVVGVSSTGTGLTTSVLTVGTSGLDVATPSFLGEEHPDTMTLTIASVKTSLYSLLRLNISVSFLYIFIFFNVQDAPKPHNFPMGIGNSAEW